MKLKAEWNVISRSLARGRTEDALELLSRVPELISVDRPRTVLWIAAQHGNAEVVRVALESGADPCRIGWDGCSCSLPEKPIVVAARNAHLDVVKMLRVHHEPLDIHDACALGDRDRVNSLLQADPSQCADVRVADPEGRFALTPLHWAVFCGHREILAMLLEAGADVRPHADQSRTTLMSRLALALCRGYTDMAKVLMDAGDFPDGDREICICYAQAAYGCRQDSIDLLLNHDLDINARRADEEHGAFVHVRHPRFDSWLLLLDNGIELDAQRRNGKTMLHIAAARGLKTFVGVLLERGANHGVRDEQDLTALDYARGRKNQKMYEYLVDHGIES